MPVTPSKKQCEISGCPYGDVSCGYYCAVHHTLICVNGESPKDHHAKKAPCAYVFRYQFADGKYSVVHSAVPGSVVFYALRHGEEWLDLVGNKFVLSMLQEVERLTTLPGWKPTSENINALPEPVRKFIHDIETNADPAGMVRENTMLRDENAALRARAAEPVPMILHCPTCGAQHVDMDEWATTRLHRKHRCNVCGHIWKAANVYTVGVDKLPEE